MVTDQDCSPSAWMSVVGVVVGVARVGGCKGHIHHSDVGRVVW